MHDIYEELARLAARYEELHSLFQDFYKAGVPLLTGGSVRGIEVSPLVEDRYFDVTCAGTTARFAFIFLGDELKARVTCVRLNPPNGLEPSWLESVGHFDFNGEGVVYEIKMPKGSFEGDRFLVGTDSHACLLVASLLYKGSRPD
jgi:hypothetical protein